MRGIIARGPREIGLSPDGKQCRLILLDEADEEFFVQLDVGELEAFIPLLAKATAAAQQDAEAVVAIPAVAGEVGDSQTGEVLLTLRTDTGAEFLFTLDERAAADLNAALETALKARAEKSPPPAPTQAEGRL